MSNINKFSFAGIKRKLVPFLTLALVVAPTATLISCANYYIPVTTTPDGYKYIEWRSWDSGKPNNDDEATLIEFPQEETITIPEKVDRKKFKQIGYYFEDKEKYKNTMLLRPDNNAVKTLIFNRQVDVKYAKLSNLETLEYSNPLNWISPNTTNKVIDPYKDYFHNDFIAPAMKNISLSQNTFESNGQIIWLYINTIRDASWVQEFNFIIPSGALSASSLVIGTDRQAPQDTWSDGWSGDNRVIWNVSMTDFFGMRTEEDNA